MRKQFTQTLKDILHSDSRTCLLLGDIGVYGFRDEIKNLSNRVYNIGILEQSTVSLAAGLSKESLIPFVHTIAPFLVERAFEQLKIDFGYQKLNGNFISVGSSYDYASLGCTHHCPGDVSLMLTIPEMSIVIPGSDKELNLLLKEIYTYNYPKYFRLSEHQHNVDQDVVYGKGNLVKKGSKATIICFGPMLDNVMRAVESIDVTILYYSTIMPFDKKILLENFNDTIIICEPFYKGTTTHIVCDALHGKKYSITNIGIPRKFLYNYGSKIDHDIAIGFDHVSLKNTILSCLK